MKLTLKNNLTCVFMDQVSVLSGSKEAAQERATLVMGLVAGSTVMTLTLIWGISVILASYDLSEATPIDKSGSQKIMPKGAVDNDSLALLSCGTLC